jgi:uncharacterized damage-inducible protein DinB
MALDLDALIQGVRASRRYFLKHIQGLGDEQWDWKPYPECKTIRETLAHLVSDDRAFLEMMDKGKITDYDAFDEQERDVSALLILLAESHENLCRFLRARFADVPVDTEVNSFFGRVPLGTAISGISSEDYYHAGQVAFIRIATDPQWKYYASIYSNL